MLFVRIMLLLWNNRKAEYKKAFQYLRRAAELGVENANFLVGNIYEHGFACKRSVIEAIKFYQVAAKIIISGLFIT